MVPRFARIAGGLLLLGIATADVTSDELAAVRSADTVLRVAFLDGCRRSSTFRDLGRRIQASRGVVLVSTGSCRGNRGCLKHWIAAAGERRYLRVIIDVHRARNEVVATIGHELQHALEVLEDPTIRNVSAIYWRFRGTLGEARGNYETPAAIAIEDRIRHELAGPLATAARSLACATTFSTDGM